MIKVTKTGQIGMDYNEMTKTRNIEMSELSCGHYILPINKLARYLESVICPICQKKVYYEK